VGIGVVVIWTILVTSTVIAVGVISEPCEKALQDVKSTASRQVKGIGVFMNRDLVLKRFSRLTVSVIRMNLLGMWHQRILEEIPPQGR
jgi:hypothetical protein